MMSAAAATVRSDSEPCDIHAPIPGNFALASGDPLQDGHIVIRRFGALDRPQVVAMGGISAGRDVCGAKGWWRTALIEHGGVDLNRFGVIGLEFSPLGDERVRVTPQDQARLIEIALDHIGAPRLHAFIGASYGGMVGLALAASAPQRLERLCVISAAHRPSAQSLAWRGVQRRIVEFALTQGAGAEGLSLARQLAMITYRTPGEFETRFGSGIDKRGRGEVDRYLEARGWDYASRVGPRRWLSLSESIDRHLVDPQSVIVPATVVATPGDQLAPVEDMQALAGALPKLRRLELLPSIFGHDAFLKEPAQLGPIIRACLEDPSHG
jgi:homoserine O-acetyltransferase